MYDHMSELVDYHVMYCKKEWITDCIFKFVCTLNTFRIYFLMYETFYMSNKSRNNCHH